MKVVEKLFVNYLNIQASEYEQKYLSAMSVLEITEPKTSEAMKKVRLMRDHISDAFPISIFRASRFLKSKETKLFFKIKTKQIEINKARGDDYKLRDELGVFIEKLNGIVISSMSKYNTDRGRNTNAEPDFDFDGIE